MGNAVTLAENKKSVLSIDSLVKDPFALLTGKDFEDDMNPQGIVIGSLLIGFVIGNSVGTAKTASQLGVEAPKENRVHLGPVYFW